MTDTGTAVPVTLAPDELPVPFGIDAETGAPLAGLTETDLQRIVADVLNSRSVAQVQEMLDVLKPHISVCPKQARYASAP